MTTRKHSDDNDDEELRQGEGGGRVCSVSNTAHFYHFGNI